MLKHTFSENRKCGFLLTLLSINVGYIRHLAGSVFIAPTTGEIKEFAWNLLWNWKCFNREIVFPLTYGSCPMLNLFESQSNQLINSPNDMPFACQTKMWQKYCLIFSDIRYEKQTYLLKMKFKRNTNEIQKKVKITNSKTRNFLLLHHVQNLL